MLKIIDSIDLKELYKYGFKRIQCLPILSKIVYYDDNKLYDYIEYDISTKTRKIEIKTICILDRPMHFVIDDTIYDLIKANLIEKVDK